MARPRKIEEEKLMELLNEYILRNPVGMKLVISSFVHFVQMQGHGNVTNYDICRSKKVKAEIDRYNEQWRHAMAQGAEIDMSLDPARILEASTTKEKMLQNLEILTKMLRLHVNKSDTLVKEKLELETKLRDSAAQLADAKAALMQLSKDYQTLFQSIKIIKIWLRESQEQMSVEALLEREGIKLKSDVEVREWTGKLILPPPKEPGAQEEMMDLAELDDYVEQTDFMADFYDDFGEDDDDKED